MEVAEPAVRVRHFTEQKGPPVTQTRGIPAELMACIGLRHRRGTLRDTVSDEQKKPFRSFQGGRIEAQLCCERRVKDKKARVRSLLGPPRNGHFCKLSGEATVKDNGGFSCGSHLLRIAAMPYRQVSSRKVRETGRRRTLATITFTSDKGWFLP
jgi:hypothetical protein